MLERNYVWGQKVAVLGSAWSPDDELWIKQQGELGFCGLDHARQSLLFLLPKLQHKVTKVEETLNLNEFNRKWLQSADVYFSKRHFNHFIRTFRTQTGHNMVFLDWNFWQPFIYVFYCDTLNGGLKSLYFLVKQKVVFDQMLELWLEKWMFEE